MKAWQVLKQGMGKSLWEVGRKKKKKKTRTEINWIISELGQMRIHRYQIRIKIKRDLIMFPHVVIWIHSCSLEMETFKITLLWFMPRIQL